MKVIVIADKGFVGSHLIKRLERDGHEACPVSRGWRGIYQHYDAIVNCAGTFVGSSEMYRDNVTLVYDWLESMRSGRFVQIGSSSETGPLEGPRSETTVCRPSNVYEHTKLAATSLCLGAATLRDLDVCVARPFSLYGPDDKPRAMIPTLWRAWKEGTEFVCHPGGHDWLHIDDFIDGLMLLLHAPRAATQGHIYHFGTGVSTSNEEVLHIFNRAVGGSGVAYKLSPDKYRPYDVTDWRSDSSKARASLGWTPKVDICEGITRLVHHHWFSEELSQSL